jgi:hypothetical protein
MVCSIIDECRCYAYSDATDPKKYQFCGTRRGKYVIECPEDECCAGGCPGQTPNTEPREPFRIINREKNNRIKAEYSIFLILLLIALGLILVFMT